MMQVVHQLHQRLTMAGGNCHQSGTFLLFSGIFLLEDMVNDSVASFLHHGYHSLVHRILVLEKPSSDVVSNDSSVMSQFEMGLWLAFLGRLGLAKFVILTQMLAHELLQVGLVSSLGDDALFLQHGQDAHLFLNQLNGGQQVHAKIDKGPLDTLLLVLFLLLDEHVVVEELLETLVSVVDEEPFQGVELENLKTGNVQDTDELFPWIRRVKRVIDKSNDPIEHSGVQRLGSGRNGKCHLVFVLTLFDKIFADLQFGFHESVHKVVAIDTNECGSFGHFLHTIGLSLLLATLLFPLGIAEVANGDGCLVKSILLILIETQCIESLISCLHLLFVIHARDSQHSLSDEEEVTRVGILAQKSHVVVFGVERAHELVEDVVITFDLKLEGNTRLFQKVSLDIGGGDLVGGAKVDTNELTKSGRVVVSDSLCIAISFQWRVGLDNLLLKRTSIFTLRCFGLGGLRICAVQSVILQHLFGVLSFASARLASNQRRLMLVLHFEKLQRAVSDGIQMRRSFIPSFVAVVISHNLSVDHQPFVGVDANAEQTGISVNLQHLIPSAKIVQNTSLVKN